MPAVRGIMKPPTVDKETVLSDYRRQFAAAAYDHVSNNQEKITALILALTAKALKILPNIPDDNKIIIPHWHLPWKIRYGTR